MGNSAQPDERVGLLVLAAGIGSRMRSSRPKALHTVAGIPMVERVLRAGAGACPDVIALVVSPRTTELTSHLGSTGLVTVVVQDPARGTGDAVRRGLDALPGIDRLIVLYCDHPLLESDSVAALLAGSRTSGAKVTILGAVLDDAAGFGRIARDEHRRPIGVVERADDDPRLRIGPLEINSGMMALDADWARRALREISPSPATGELYLTDLVATAVAGAPGSGPWPVAVVAGTPDDALGVNDRVDLARAEARAWARKRERLMREGVTIRLPETVVIDEDVSIGRDTVIFPHTQITGVTSIGEACIIGPATVLHHAQLGDRVSVRTSTIEESSIADETDVGPYAHIRRGCEIGPRVHVGNFAEIKNARLAAGVKVGHFSYLGDVTIGEHTNIGAGAITANFDGVAKHHTTIGARAFIGSDTILRAPVRVGDDARTGAGSVVTRDVPDGATVVGLPARVVRRKPDIADQNPGEV